MICTKCGAVVAEEKQFCMNCGLSVADMNSTNIQQTNSEGNLSNDQVSEEQSKVQQPIRPLLDILDNGNQMTEADIIYNSNPKTNKSNSKVVLAVMVGLVGLLAVGIGLFLQYSNANNNLSLTTREVVFGSDKIKTPYTLNSDVKPLKVSSCGTDCVLIEYPTEYENEEYSEYLLEEYTLVGVSAHYDSDNTEEATSTITFGKSSLEKDKYISIILSSNGSKTSVEISKKAGAFEKLLNNEDEDSNYDTDFDLDDDTDYGTIIGDYKVAYSCTTSTISSKTLSFDGEGNFTYKELACDGSSSNFETGNYSSTGDNMYLLEGYSITATILVSDSGASIRMNGEYFLQQ